MLLNLKMLKHKLQHKNRLLHLSVENARLNAMKVEEEATPEKEVNITPQQTTTKQQSDPKAEDWALEIVGLVMIQQ